MNDTNMQPVSQGSVVYNTQEVWTEKPLSDSEYLAISKRYEKALKESMEVTREQLEINAANILQREFSA